MEIAIIGRHLSVTAVCQPQSLLVKIVFNIANCVSFGCSIGEMRIPTLLQIALRMLPTPTKSSLPPLVIVMFASLATYEGLILSRI